VVEVEVEVGVEVEVEVGVAVESRESPQSGRVCKARGPAPRNGRDEKRRFTDLRSPHSPREIPLELVRRPEVRER
jgi:hypothetical protein